MTFPVGGYEYETDAETDGVIHYYPFYEEDGDNSKIQDYIGPLSFTVGGTDLEACRVTSQLIGTSFDATASGTGVSHNYAYSTPDLTSSLTYYDWSVAFWVRFKSIFDNEHALNISELGGFSVYINVTTLDFDFTSASVSTMSAGAVTTDTDYFVVVTGDAVNGTEIFLNNVSKGTDIDTQPLRINDAKMVLAGFAGNSGEVYYLDGYIDELVIYNRVLDSTDRANLYNSGAGVSVIKHINGGRALVDEGVKFTGSGSWSWDISVSEQTGISEDIINYAVYQVLAIADELGLDDTNAAVGAVRFVPLTADTFSLGDESLQNYLYYASGSDQVNFITSFNVSGESYLGVVMNTQNQAVTEYGNFDFNSMAYLGNNQYYGCKNDGIYELDGADDEGAQIDAFLSTNLTNFGSQEWKRVERAYLGLRNDGPMVLKVIVRDDPTSERKEYWYELTETSEAARIERIKIGKGLKSHYWQFELHSNQGADFDLESLEFVPIVLSRRV